MKSNRERHTPKVFFHQTDQHLAFISLRKLWVGRYRMKLCLLSQKLLSASHYRHPADARH